jgi:hypothetical protein
MGDGMHEKSSSALLAVVSAALTEQHHAKSSLHAVFTGQRATETTS